MPEKKSDIVSQSRQMEVPCQMFICETKDVDDVVTLDDDILLLVEVIIVL